MSDHGILMVGLACLFTGLAAAVLLWRSAGTTSPVAASLAAVNRLSIHVPSPPGPAEPLVRRLVTPFTGQLRSLSSRLSSTNYNRRLQLLLDKAGNPRGWTLDQVLAYKALALLGGAFFGVLAGSHAPARLVLFALIGGAAGFWLPDLLIYNSGVKRQERIQKALPDSLDLLTISVEAGLGFDAALAQVARNTEGPIAAEFYRVLQEMQIGKSRQEALRGLGERTTVSDMRTFASAIVQADGLGIPVANVLREQANEMRLKRSQRAEEQAQKVTVKIMVPLVMCILPSLFVVVIGPGAISIVHAFSHHA